MTEERPGKAPARFQIRPYRSDDVPRLYEAVRESVREIAAWLPWAHAGYSITDSAAWVETRPRAWQEDRSYDFIILDQESGTLVGGVGLNQLDRQHQLANLGYWVRSSWAGRGAASAGARLAAGFGFRQLGLQRLEIIMAVGNIASRKVAEKAGASREGRLRNRLLISGLPHEAYLYSLIREEWRDEGVADFG